MNNPRRGRKKVGAAAADENVDVEAFLEKEMASIIGLSSVKETLQQFVKNMRLEARRKEVGAGTAADGDKYDMLFYGNPGTGKTSVARVIPPMLKILQLRKNGAFVEVSRQDLVGSVIGATEKQTMEKIKEASGGVVSECFMPLL